jgi:peroxiredoxin
VSAAQTLAEAFESICMMDAPLNQRMAAYANKLRELNFPFAEAYDDLVARLALGEIGTEAPDIGDVMPPFILPSLSGSLVSLQELAETGPVVLSFNRGHWCPFCKIELRTLAEHHEKFSQFGAKIVSIVPDRQIYTAQLREQTRNHITILSDIDNGYALSLGLVLWLGERIKDIMRGRGQHLDAYQGNDGWFVPLPATYVLGKGGRVLARKVDPEFRSTMEIDDIIEALKSSMN